MKYTTVKYGLNLIKKYPKISLSIISGGVGFWQYNSYKKLKLPFHTLERDITELKNDTIKCMDKSKILDPIDRLYLMRDVDEISLVSHEYLNNELDNRTKNLNKLEKSIAHWENKNTIQQLIAYFTKPSIEIEKLKEQLQTVETLLSFGNNLNLSLLNYKKRLYSLSQNYSNNTLELLKNYTAFSIDLNAQKILTHNALLAHNYNLQAKLARCEERYKASNNLYKLALDATPDDIVIIMSRVALWGDLAWKQKNKDIKPLEKLLLDKTKLTELAKKCQNYPLGLTNLSWLYIQAANNKKVLNLDDHKVNHYLQEAEKLSEQAKQLITKTSDPAASFSVNAWLFHGITLMHRANLTKNSINTKQRNLLLESALEDFETGLYLRDNTKNSETPHQDHPSLLRRRALALEELGKPEAVLAYHQALIELNYRIKSGSNSNIYVKWRNDCLKYCNAHPISNDPIINLLSGGKFDDAYKKLSQISVEAMTSIEREHHQWFARHFKIYGGKLVCFKRREALLQNLDLHKLPSPYDFSLLSESVYTPNSKPLDWKILYKSSKVFKGQSTSGYSGVVYQHEGTGQIVIAHAGTDISELKDLQADIYLTLGKDHQQLKIATEFTLYAIKNLSNEVGHVPYIYHTGHSLGGHLASYLACTLPSKKWLHYAVTFDNPSCWFQFNTSTKNELSSLPEDKNADFPITAFLTRPSFINCAGGKHLGQRIKIRPITSEDQPQLPQLIVKKLITEYMTKQLKKTGFSALSITQIAANINCHNMQHIHQFFQIKNDYSQSDKIYDIQKWPHDLKQWYTFETETANKKINPLDVVKIKNNEYQCLPILSSNNSQMLSLANLPSTLRTLISKVFAEENQNKNGTVLTSHEKYLSNHFKEYLLKWTCLSDDGKNLILTGPLNRWETYHLFHIQLYQACQHHPSLDFNAEIYPTSNSWMMFKSNNTPYKFFTSTKLLDSAETLTDKNNGLEPKI